MITIDTKNHLRGIVALWMTNGNKPVDASNDTRYDFFSGGWIEAAEATGELVEAGLVEIKGATDQDVVPTAKGIFEAMS